MARARRRSGGGGLSTAAQVARFIGVSVLAGALLAGLALPAVGALGLAAKETLEGFDEIPDAMLTPQLSQKTRILDSEGNEIAEVYSRNRTVVDLDEMSPWVKKAIVAIEDARFYEHGAVDLQGTLRALLSNVESGSVSQGGSTLTQQYVKNVFVEEAGDDPEAVAEATTQTGAKGIGRKIREIKYAIQLEEQLTKDEILENYLNITYFGEQAYGIEAASQRYFSKSADDLELHEAALLAGLVQSPSAYDPLVYPDSARERRDTVLDSMVDTGDITRQQANEAKAEDLGLNPSEPRNGCITAREGAEYFCDYVREEFLSNPAFGETRDDRQALWARGGLTIYTSLDPQAQDAAVESVTDHVYADDSVAASVVQVEPGTGHILSMAQSRPYGNDASQNQTVLNLNVSSDMGGSTNGFQVGSTFKPITAAAALEEGISPAQTYTTDHEITVDMSSFTDCEGNELGSDEEQVWEVSNEREDEQGTWDMTSALAESINTYFVKLEQQVGLCETLTMAESLGVRRGNGDKLSADPSVTLGAQETTPLAMASAYATFANRGTYCEPKSIVRVVNSEGEKLNTGGDQCQQVMSSHTADTINEMLGGVVEDGTGQAVGLTDRDNAGKTGTTDGRKDVWFVGYTPDISTAVHVGSDSEPISMTDITIGGVYYEEASGAGVAGPIWKQAMEGALAGTEASSFNDVDVPRGNESSSPDDGGDTGGGNDGGDGGDGGDDDDDGWGWWNNEDNNGNGNDNGGNGNGGGNRR